MDPKAEEYFGWSPYNYVINNPIKMIDPDGRSGEVTIDEKNKTVTVSSNIILYGSAANADLAKQYATKTQNMWNAAKATVKIGDNTYKVVFNISGQFRQDGEELKTEITSNTDIKNNYFRVDKTTDDSDGASYADVSKKVNEQGGNTGYLSSDQVSRNNLTTVPHEYGHLFGLNHPATDQRNAVPPSIMTTAQNWGAPGYSDNAGWVNPVMRQVTKGDVNSLGLNKLEYDKTGKANIGSLTNYYHYNGGYYYRK